MSTPAQRMERELGRTIEAIRAIDDGRYWETVDALRSQLSDARANARDALRSAELALAAGKTCPRCAGEGECPCP